MRAWTRRTLAHARRSRVAAAMLAAAAAAFPTPSPAPVQYVKTCPSFGPGFFYYPGTDTCYSPSTHEARVMTAGGVWSWRMPNNPVTWVASPAQACSGGHLVKFGDITGADLIYNAYDRLETTTHLSVPAGQYVSSVMYQGGLTGLGESPVDYLPACPSPNAAVFDATDTNCTPGNTPVGGGSMQCEVTCDNGAWVFAPQQAPRYTVDSLPACPAPRAVVTDATDVNCNNGDAPAGTGSTSCVVACSKDDNQWYFAPLGSGGVSQYGDFCMYYHYHDLASGQYAYVPLGCSTATQVVVPATRVFSPDKSVPPVPPSGVDILGAGGSLGGALFTSDIRGTLSIWLCLRDNPGTGSSGGHRRRR